MPIGREASDVHQFPYIHLSTFIIQEYKTTQSNLSSYKDSLAHPSAARHIKDSSPLFQEQCLRTILNTNALIGLKFSTSET